MSFTGVSSYAGIMPRLQPNYLIAPKRSEGAKKRKALSEATLAYPGVAACNLRDNFRSDLSVFRRTGVNDDTIMKENAVFTLTGSKAAESRRRRSHAPIFQALNGYVADGITGAPVTNAEAYAQLEMMSPELRAGFVGAALQAVTGEQANNPQNFGRSMVKPSVCINGIVTFDHHASQFDTSMGTGAIDAWCGVVFDVPLPKSMTALELESEFNPAFFHRAASNMSNMIPGLVYPVPTRIDDPSRNVVHRTFSLSRMLHNIANNPMKIKGYQQHWRRGTALPTTCEALCHLFDKSGSWTMIYQHIFGVFVESVKRAISERNERHRDMPAPKIDILAMPLLLDAKLIDGLLQVTRLEWDAAKSQYVEHVVHVHTKKTGSSGISLSLNNEEEIFFTPSSSYPSKYELPPKFRYLHDVTESDLKHEEQTKGRAVTSFIRQAANVYAMNFVDALGTLKRTEGDRKFIYKFVNCTFPENIDSKNMIAGVIEYEKNLQSIKTYNSPHIINTEFSVPGKDLHAFIGLNLTSAARTTL